MKYLVFRDDSTTAKCFPDSSLKQIRFGLNNAGSVQTDQVDMYFDSYGEKAKIQLAVNSGTRQSVMENLMKAIAGSKSDIIVVANDVSREYVISDIQSITFPVV